MRADSYEESLEKLATGDMDKPLETKPDIDTEKNIPPKEWEDLWWKSSFDQNEVQANKLNALFIKTDFINYNNEI